MALQASSATVLAHKAFTFRGSPVSSSVVLRSSFSLNTSAFRTMSMRYVQRLMHSRRMSLSVIGQSNEATSPIATQIPPARSLQDIMTDLSRRVSKRVLKNRREDNGMSVTYLPWFQANQMLNFYAPGWHGEVRSIQYAPNETVNVVYRVTINGTDGSVYRESSGTAGLADSSFGDPVQKAEAMAFRRACARFGLGLHLYSDEEPSSSAASSPSAVAAASPLGEEKYRGGASSPKARAA